LTAFSEFIERLHTLMTSQLFCADVTNRNKWEIFSGESPLSFSLRVTKKAERGKK